MEQQLNGSYRVVIDGLATQEECNKLMHLGLVRQVTYEAQRCIAGKLNILIPCMLTESSLCDK